MKDSQGDSLTVEPFGFFSVDALKAGWYLLWRQGVRVLAVIAGAGILFGVLSLLGLTIVGAIVFGLGVAAASIWSIVLIPQLTSQWATMRYGYPLTGAGRVWWGVVWRVFVVSLVAGVILTPPTLVATSLTTSYGASALGLVGQLLSALLAVANVAVSLLATGWAMSRVTASQLSGLPIARVPVAPPPPDDVPGFGAAPAMATAPVAAASTLGAAPAPHTVRTAAGAEGKRQCPKCGLYETERGTVIGWYCTICGWRESRR